MADPQEPAESGRDAKGRFAAGYPSANPGGRPAGLDPWRILLATAAKIAPRSRKTYLEAALDAAWRRAAAGSAEHLRILLDRLAPARLALEHSGEIAVGVPLDVLERAQTALDELIASHPERVQELLQ